MTLLISRQRWLTLERRRGLSLIRAFDLIADLGRGVRMSRAALILELCQELRWLEQRVDCYSKTVIKELRYDPGQQWATDLQTRVSVGLDEENLKILIDHEVVPKDLEAVRDAIRVNLRANGAE